MSLGENIYNLRKRKKLSQEDLSERIGVTRQTISNWELNETTPNPNQLKLLSKVLDISIDELVGNKSMQTRREEKKIISNKYNIPFLVSIICSIVWAYAAIIAFIEGNELGGMIYLSLCIVWIINALIFYYKVMKNE